MFLRFKNSGIVRCFHYLSNFFNYKLLCNDFNYMQIIKSSLIVNFAGPVEEVFFLKHFALLEVRNSFLYFFTILIVHNINLFLIF